MMKNDDFKLLRGFADRRTDDRQTDERIFVNVESLSRLKIHLNRKHICSFNPTLHYDKMIKNSPCKVGLKKFMRLNVNPK